MNYCRYLCQRVFAVTILVTTLVSALMVLNVKASMTIEQLNFKDASLSKCITTLTKKNNWQNIDTIKKIQCHGMHIKSLEGLEALTSLEYLSLYNNEIKTTDLTTLNHLYYLNIANNKLQSIKLNGLSQLKTLYLFKNKLKKINFTGLKQLTKIRITNNKLTQLDISPLISLEKAYFFDNKLEDLIVAGLPKLKFIELRQNPMPDEVYDRYDALEGITIIHDGNADDWK